MTRLTLISLLLLFSIFGFAQNEIPELNRNILDYITTTIGTKVNRGECWDLAYEALNRNNAAWDGKFKYGVEINPKKQMVYPGDLIQFANVEIRYQRGNTTYTETMGQHTAIVYKVIDQEKKIFQIAHQNTNFSGRKVGLSDLDLNTVVKGKYWFYRPQPIN